MLLFRWWLRAALLPLLLAISAGYAVTMFTEYRRRERPERRKRAFDFFNQSDFLNNTVLKSPVLNNPVGDRVKEMYDYLSGRNGNGESQTVNVGGVTPMRDVDTTAKAAPKPKAAEAKPEKFPEAEEKASKKAEK